MNNEEKIIRDTGIGSTRPLPDNVPTSFAQPECQCCKKWKQKIASLKMEEKDLPDPNDLWEQPNLRAEGFNVAARSLNSRIDELLKE